MCQMQMREIWLRTALDRVEPTTAGGLAPPRRGVNEIEVGCPVDCWYHDWGGDALMIHFLHTRQDWTGNRLHRIVQHMPLFFLGSASREDWISMAAEVRLHVNWSTGPG